MLIKREGRLSVRQALLLGTGLASFCILAAIALLLISDEQARKAAAAAQPKTELVYQGGMSVEQADLAALTCQEEAGAVRMELRFKGFDAAGRPQEVFSIPKLSIHQYHDPFRLAIHIPGLVAWNYVSSLNLGSQSLVTGVFLYDKTLYLQLSRQVSVSLEGQGGTLNLRLRPLSASSLGSGYRVVVDALDRIDYTALAKTLIGMGMLPTQCDDGESVLLMSPALESPRAARMYAQSLQWVCEQGETSGGPQVIPLAAGALPKVQAQTPPTRLPSAFDASRMRLVMWDAKILAHTLDMETMLVQRGNESLLILRDDGRRKPLYTSRMPNLAAASMSFDGDWVALSTVEEAVLLYGEGRLRRLGEPFLGMTRTMAWTEGDLLYAMTGSPKFMYCLDPSLEEKDPAAVTLADDYRGMEGHFVGRGKLLYLQDPQGIVYRCDPEAGSRVSFVLGNHFELSRDGRVMAVQTGSEEAIALKMVDTVTGKETMIKLGTRLVDFCVSGDGSKVYYLEREGEGYVLSAFSSLEGKSRRIGKMGNSQLYPTDADDSLMVNVEVEGIWAVYELSL